MAKRKTPPPTNPGIKEVIRYTKQLTEYQHQCQQNHQEQMNAQNQINVNFAHEISSLKDRVTKLESAPSSSSSVKTSGIKPKKAPRNLLIKIFDGNTTEGTATVFEHSEVPVDANGRYECPYCKKTFSAGYFRTHIRKVCVTKGTKVSMTQM